MVSGQFRFPKVVAAGSRRADGTNRLAPPTEFLHSIVLPVRHVHIALRPDPDPRGEIELTETWSLRAEGKKVRAIQVEDHDPMAGLVDDEHVPGGIDCNVPGHQELTRSGAGAAEGKNG
jgi:hypothetical protein